MSCNPAAAWAYVLCSQSDSKSCAQNMDMMLGPAESAIDRTDCLSSGLGKLCLLMVATPRGHVDILRPISSHVSRTLMRHRHALRLRHALSGRVLAQPGWHHAVVFVYTHTCTLRPCLGPSRGGFRPSSSYIHVHALSCRILTQPGRLEAAVLVHTHSNIRRPRIYTHMRSQAVSSPSHACSALLGDLVEYDGLKCTR